MQNGTSFNTNFERSFYYGEIIKTSKTRMGFLHKSRNGQTNIQQPLPKMQKQTVDMKMLYQGLMEFTEMKQLTPTVVNKLIERIEIHNNEKKHSHNNVKVDIYFTAVGPFDLPSEQKLIETMNKIQEQNKSDEKSA